MAQCSVCKITLNIKGKPCPFYTHEMDCSLLPICKLCAHKCKNEAFYIGGYSMCYEHRLVYLRKVFCQLCEANDVEVIEKRGRLYCPYSDKFNLKDVICHYAERKAKKQRGEQNAKSSIGVAKTD